MKPTQVGGPVGDFVQLIEVDGSASFAAPQVPAGRDSGDWPVRGLQQWAWWSAAARSTRSVAALALAGVVAAVGMTVAAGSASHPVVHVARTVPAPVHFGGTDALGCPVRSVCVVRSSAALGAVGEHSFADVSGYDVLGMDRSARTLARYATASRGASRLRIVASCDSHRRRAAVDEPPQIGSTVTYQPGISVVSAGGGGSVVTAYYARHDTFGCTVEVMCSYPLPTLGLDTSARLDTTVEQCAVAVAGLGMDSRVYL